MAREWGQGGSRGYRVQAVGVWDTVDEDTQSNVSKGTQGGHLSPWTLGLTKSILGPEGLMAAGA